MGCICVASVLTNACADAATASRQAFPLEAPGKIRPSTRVLERATLAQQEADDWRTRAFREAATVQELEGELRQARANLAATETAARKAQADAARAFDEAKATVPPTQARILLEESTHAVAPLPPAQVSPPQLLSSSNDVVEGSLIWSTDGAVRLLERPGEGVVLHLTPQTKIYLDGEVAAPLDLPAGADVRARYDLLPGGPTALRLDVTSGASSKH